MSVFTVRDNTASNDTENKRFRYNRDAQNPNEV